MESANSLALGVYLLALLTLGVASARTVGGNAEAFVLGRRRLPWWALGFADLATRTAHDAAWVAALLIGAVVGLHVEYGLAVAIALPAGIIFGRYRRRLQITSGPEFLQARYGSSGAVLRPYAAVAAAFVGTVVLGELLRVGGNALGAWAGGVTIDRGLGLGVLPLVAAVITAIGLLLALWSLRLDRPAVLATQCPAE